MVPGIPLSNGHRLDYVIASGGLAYDGKGWLWDQPLRWCGLLDEGLFTTVMKTVTRTPRRGNFRWYNPFGCVRFIPGGTVNAFGLTNPGVVAVCRRIKSKIDSQQAPLVGSILGEPGELAEMAEMMNDLDLVGLEVNASCPNTGDDILRNSGKVAQGFEAVKKVSRHPVIAKLSVAHDLNWIVPRIKGIAETIDINSVPWRLVFPDRKSPLAHLGGGGVSGRAAQPFTWRMVKDLKEMTSIPVIGPSVWDYPDIDRLIALRARAVSFGAVLMHDPCRPTAFVLRHGAQ